MRRSTPKVAGRSKYNVRTDAVGKANRTVDNILFDSLKEAHRYQELKLLVRAGIITSLFLQPILLLSANGISICRYVADFRYVEVNTQAVIYEDVKGCKTSLYKLKKKLVKALLNIDIREV